MPYSLRPMPLTLVLALALLLACGLIGCSGTRSPILTVVSVEQFDETVDGSAVMITLDAENPGDEPLPLRELLYAVRVGPALFEGTRSPEATLRAFGTQRLTIPAVFAAGSAPASGATFTVSGTLVYVAPGELAEALFDAGLRRPSVSFEGEGAFRTR